MATIGKYKIWDGREYDCEVLETSKSLPELLHIHVTEWGNDGYRYVWPECVTDIHEGEPGMYAAWCLDHGFGDDTTDTARASCHW